MKRALHTLLALGRSRLGLVELGVRVRSDNTTLQFHRKADYREIRRGPLGPVEEPGIINWVEDESLETAKLYLVYTRWQADKQE